MAEESENDNSKRRRGWVQSLAVLSSDNEDSDAGSVVESPSTSSVDTGQVIALRFPYPMFSDESEEENPLKYSPSGYSSGKRKISLPSDEDITTSKENHSYKHKKRKMKPNTNENNIKESHNCDKKLASQDVVNMSNTILKSKSNRNEASNNREKSSSLSCRTSKRPRNVLKPVSVYNSSSESDNVFQDKTVVIRINPRRCKQIYNKIVDSSESSDDEDGKVKVINDESNLLTSAKPTSRFLDSTSSDGDHVKCSAKRKKLKATSSSRANFRRLHFLSTSSSSSDEDAEQKVNECKLYIKKPSAVPCHSISTSSNEKENDSDTNVIPAKDKIVNNKVNTSSVEPCHSISASSNEKDSDNDVYFVPALHKGNRVKIPNVSFSDSSNNSNESHQINKIINSSELEYRARKRYLPNGRLNIKTGRPNLNSSAWKNIANAELKAEAKSSSHQSIVQHLKKKLLSCNMSSVEVHKKMHSRPITINKEVEGRSDSTKRLKLSLKSHDKLEELISDHLGDVTVTKVSEDNCTKENISVDNSELVITAQANSREDDPRENRNVNVDSSQTPLANGEGQNISSDSTTESKQSNLETIASQGEYEDVNVNLPNKKIRHSHFNKINSNIQNVHPFQKQTNVINKRLNIHFKKVQSNNNSKSDEICSTKNATENSSIECDVLGNILSQMENNRYKVQKVPTKKTADPTGQMLGWSESPALTGQGQSQYHSGLINSQNVNKDNLQFNRRQHTENVPIAYQNEMTTTRTNIIQNSTLPSYSPLNNIDELHNSKTNTNNEIRRVDSIKPINKPIDITNTGKKRLPDTEVVIPFYSAVSEEYVVTNSDQGNNTQATTNDLSMPRNSSSENASYKNVTNHMKGYKNKSTEDNRTHRKYKKAIVDTDVKLSGKSKHNYEENIKTKVSSKNPKQFKQKSNKRSVTRKTNSGEKSDDNVGNSIREPIKIGPFICTDLAGNVKINGERTKDFLAKQTNNVENETTPKGIRIRFGGNVFRLTGRTNMTNENNNLNTDCDTENIVTNKATTNSNSKRRSSVGYGANEPEKSQVVKHTNCSLNQSTDLPPSRSDNGSSSSDETSSSSSSKSDSTDDLNINRTNSTTDMSISGGKSSSASVSRLNSILEEDGMEEKGAGASVIPNTTKEALIVEKEGVRKSKSLDNSTSDNVISLLDSSDSENGDETINRAHVSEVKTGTPNTTTQLEKHGNSSEIQNNNLSAGKVGTIRVKSLKELGLCSNNPLPENALPSTLSVSESPSVDLDLNLPKALPLQDSMLNKLLDRVHNEEIRPSPSKSTTPSQTLVCNLDKLFQVLPKSTESHKNQQKAVAVIKPVCSNSTATSNPNNSLANSLEKAINITESVIQQNVSSEVPPRSANPPTSTAGISNTENRDMLQTHATAAKFLQVPLASKAIETLFFKLYDSLFTELVYFKIPKLVDDLHLSIVYDIMKEERLKKIDQLISPETIAIEKRRAEKDFADMIKIRGQSFVPLFMTIVNKINKVDLKSLVIAVYCRIVQQLERVDPMNSSYRFKLRHLIKSMIEKFSYGKHEDLCAIFGESDTSFLTSFVFIENLLSKYDKCVEERRLASVQLELTSNSGDNNISAGNNTNPHPTAITNTVGNIGAAPTLASVTESVVAPTEVERVQHPPLNVSGPPPPPIGNLDQMLLFKLKTPAKPHAM